MKKGLLLFVTFVLVFEGFSQNSRPMETAFGTAPPGTLQLKTNLFIDKKEVSNRMYLEFLNWAARIYGKDSEKYQGLIPETEVWEKLKGSYDGLSESYLRRPKFQTHPVVGVSYDQARAFAEWRSDRVMEYFLIKTGTIPDRRWSNQDVFTIEKYFKGKYYSIEPDMDLRYPVYQLPTYLEYRYAAKMTDSINAAYYQSNGYCGERFPRVANCLEHIKNKSSSKPYGKVPTAAISHDCLQNPILVGLAGNVREMTNKRGQLYGLSYKDSCSMPQNLVRQDNTYIDSYTGFRLVCEFKKWEGSTEAGS